MSKKKPAKKDAKNPTDEPEYTGPNIYQQLLTKGVPELEADLSAPIPEILKQNVEFEVLTDRIQSICNRLVFDNERLHRMTGKVGD